VTDNTQVGPPGCADTLVNVLERVTYKPGWEMSVDHVERRGEHLDGGEGLTLSIRFPCEDSTRPGETTKLNHLFVVPPAEYSRETWERWLLDCLIEVETHEAMEFFKVDGWAPFFPPHGPRNGSSPYTIARRAK
jgi:hypothetical protein